MDLTSIEPFEETFGTKSKRKRPKISHFSYEELAKATEEKQEVSFKTFFLFSLLFFSLLLFSLFSLFSSLFEY